MTLIVDAGPLYAYVDRDAGCASSVTSRRRTSFPSRWPRRTGCASRNSERGAAIEIRLTRRRASRHRDRVLINVLAPRFTGLDACAGAPMDGFTAPRQAAGSRR